MTKKKKIIIGLCMFVIMTVAGLFVYKQKASACGGGAQCSRTVLITYCEVGCGSVPGCGGTSTSPNKSCCKVTAWQCSRGSENFSTKSSICDGSCARGRGR